MFIQTVGIYLLIGVVMVYVEELITSAHAQEIFRDRVEVTDFDTNGIFNPITERVKNYNVDWLLTDLNDIALWPFGTIWWLRGIDKLHHMNDSEVDEIVEQMKN